MTIFFFLLTSSRTDHKIKGQLPGYRERTAWIRYAKKKATQRKEKKRDKYWDVKLWRHLESRFLPFARTKCPALVNTVLMRTTWGREWPRGESTFDTRIAYFWKGSVEELKRTWRKMWRFEETWRSAHAAILEDWLRLGLRGNMMDWGSSTKEIAF